MSDKKKIDIKKTEESGADSAQYGDASDLGLTHYLGNDENKPRRDLDEVGDEKRRDLGEVAYGNEESFPDN